MVTKFFTTEQGLTSTSANYICNIGKEYLETIHTQLQHFKPYDTFQGLIDTDTKHQTQKGNSDLSIFNKGIEEIAQINAFVSWLREAIKTKEKMMEYKFVEDEISEKMEEPKYPNEIVNQESPSMEDLLSELSEDKLAKYYALEAISAHYGKYIHPNMPLSKMRSEYLKIVNNPIEVKGHGHDAEIIEYKPTVSKEELEKLFMQLQNIYREAEKQLNVIKFELETELSKRVSDLSTKKKNAMAQYESERKIFFETLHKEVNDLIAERSKWKIKIPERFKDTYEFLNNIGKGKTE